jgi:hypothetical protein
VTAVWTTFGYLQFRHRVSGLQEPNLDRRWLVVRRRWLHVAFALIVLLLLAFWGGYRQWVMSAYDKLQGDLTKIDERREVQDKELVDLLDSIKALPMDPVKSTVPADRKDQATEINSKLAALKSDLAKVEQRIASFGRGPERSILTSRRLGIEGSLTLTEMKITQIEMEIRLREPRQR